MTINLETFDTPNALMPALCVFFFFSSLHRVYSIFIRRPLSRIITSRAFYFSLPLFLSLLPFLQSLYTQLVFRSV